MNGTENYIALKMREQNKILRAQAKAQGVEEGDLPPESHGGTPAVLVICILTGLVVAVAAVGLFKALLWAGGLIALTAVVCVLFPVRKPAPTDPVTEPISVGRHPAEDHR